MKSSTVRNVVGTTAVVVVALLAAIFWGRGGEDTPREHFAVPEFTQIIEEGRVLEAEINGLTLSGQYQKANGKVGFYAVTTAGEAELNATINVLLNHKVTTVLAPGQNRTASNRAVP